MYEFIINPDTGKKYNINGTQGNIIIDKYLSQLKGGGKNRKRNKRLKEKKKLKENLEKRKRIEKIFNEMSQRPPIEQSNIDALEFGMETHNRKKRQEQFIKERPHIRENSETRGPNLNSNELVTSSPRYHCNHEGCRRVFRSEFGLDLHRDWHRSELLNNLGSLYSESNNNNPRIQRGRKRYKGNLYERNQMPGLSPRKR